MTISILGTNGFLSTAIGYYFQQQGYIINCFGLEPPTHSYDSFYAIDLVNQNFDVSFLLDSDLIIYAIGAGIQSNLREKEDIIYKLNVFSPVSLCLQLRDKNYNGVFVSFGSYFEMGETMQRYPFAEEDVINSSAPAPNDYTVSKRMFSKFVSSYRHDFTHWHFILPTIYGQGENPNRLIPYTINALKNGLVPNFTSGEQIRQYIHVKEISVIIQKSVQMRLHGGIYNVGGVDTVSVHQLIEIIYNKLDQQMSESVFNQSERVDTAMQYLALDGSKLYNLINYNPIISIKESISDYI
ncbi:MAG: NAD(P)-dependent oxidoreductase [Prevotella sp.]|nr:NAD(P)-dependent oxidoreductase [Prevotella sp.]